MARCVVWLLVAVLVPSLAGAQADSSSPAFTGVVADQLGRAIAGARVTVIDSSGAVVQSATSSADGSFAIRGLAAGSYSVRIDAELFVPRTVLVTIPASAADEPVRFVLDAGGFAENVVVTASRVETRVAETPQTLEIIDAADLERSVAADLTDVLKKNAGVDVIQYSGALSGIGIRGFRPQTSGINKRSLLLVDGRPSGVTNLATLLLDDVSRIEVLKGAASAVYGSSAMGGVVNVITRESRGKFGGTARVGGGSFGASEFAGRAGGSVLPRLDVDVAGSAFDQRDDYRMGNGVVRPATSYKTDAGTARVGADLTGAWRLDGHLDAYRGRDIMTPGDIASGINAQGSKDLDRSSEDVRLTGTAGRHALSFTGYHAIEASAVANVTTTDPADRPFLPYLSFESDLRWAGAQLRDAWQWSRRDSIVFGFDYERVTSVSRSYSRTGARVAPFSADSHKQTGGVYAENTLRLRDGRTIVTAGGRLDRITNETIDTPLKINFTPSASTFTVFNPSVGVKQAIAGAWRAHFTAGRAFIPAEATMLTGFTSGIVGGRTQITQGNPDLKPEHSVSIDLGAEWSSRSTRFAAAVFRTVVADRFISNVVVSNPPAPAPVVVSIANGLDAHISGLDVEVDRRLGGHVALFANTTRYFNRKERLASGAQQDILNVALTTVRAGADVDFGPLSTRVAGRYVQGRKDNNFNAPGFPIIDYDDFAVVDLSATYRLARQHAVLVAVNNLFDAYYYEKLGFPLQGASFKLSYRLGFGR